MSDKLGNIIGQLSEVDLRGRHVYIWGTGNTSALYQEGFLREEWLDIYGYGVNDETQIGGEFCGKKVFSAQQVAGDERAVVLICTAQPQVYEQVSEQMKSLGVEFYSADEVIFGKRKDKLEEVLDNFDDEESKDIYLYMLKCRKECIDPDINYVSEHQYAAIPFFNATNPKDVFVDCGAFVGDTIEKFIWGHQGTFKKIIGIEPDSRNFNALSKRVSRLKEEWALDDAAIELYQCGLSDAPSTAFVKKTQVGGLGASLSNDLLTKEGEDCIDVARIDDLVREEYTFLKADIESWEYKMLLGARESIKKWHPRLAICVYHNATDFYSIPLLIRSFCSDYRMVIRQHETRLAETVLYAY